MINETYDDDDIIDLLSTVKTIALVGASAKEERPSHRVMGVLQAQGYRVYPVNPGLAGQSLLGERVYARLGDLPAPVDMVDIFRNANAAGAVVDESLALPVKPSVIWMQLGVSDTAAAAKARAQGLTVIMNRCPAIEIGRLRIDEI